MDTKLSVRDRARALVAIYATDKTWDARTMGRQVAGYDWHEWSAYLDRLYNQGILKAIGHDNDGMTQYQKVTA